MSHELGATAAVLSVALESLNVNKRRSLTLEIPIQWVTGILTRVVQSSMGHSLAGARRLLSPDSA